MIGFPKGAGGKLAAYARETGVDAVGLDETVDPVWARASCPTALPVQGNLDPLALLAGGDALEHAATRILDAFADRPHIFNLGHGIRQDTPIAHVEELSKTYPEPSEEPAAIDVASTRCCCSKTCPGWGTGGHCRSGGPAATRGHRSSPLPHALGAGLTTPMPRASIELIFDSARGDCELSIERIDAPAAAAPAPEPPVPG